MKRRITALLLFPQHSLKSKIFDQIKAEGFTDVGISVKTEKQFSGQGFSFEEGTKADQLICDRKMSLVVFTGYMKYEEQLLKREPERKMVVTSGIGDALDSDKLSVNWLCPFRPENKERYLNLLEAICQWKSLREIHLNDEASLGFSNGAIGCYCDYCCSDFKKKYRQLPPRRPDWNSELWWQWINYRMERWVEVHAYFRKKIKTIRPEVLVGIQHSPLSASFCMNPWILGINLGRDAEALDVLATDPYHGNHYHIYDYRPHRRFLTETVRVIRGATLEKPTNIYPQAYMPPGQSLELNRRDGIMAGCIPFSLGSESITPYAYELMKIIPGFFDGFRDSQKILPYLEKTRPWSFVTLLYPSQSEIYGYPEKSWGKEHIRPWVDTMYQVGFSWRWLFDNRMVEGLSRSSGTLIIPDAHCLTSKQAKSVKDFVKRGGGVLWVGQAPNEGWNGKTGCRPTGKVIEKNCELTFKDKDHLILSDITYPVFLESAVDQPGVEGKVIANINNRAALIIKEHDHGREAWLTGRPIFNYVRPGDHGSFRTPTDGIKLLRNILRWLSGTPPMVELFPYPPPNEYGKLRPWDRRDVPTMEIFPMVGDRIIMVILFNYLGLAYQTNLIARVPVKESQVSVQELIGKQNVKEKIKIERGEIRIPIDMKSNEIWRVFLLEW